MKNKLNYYYLLALLIILPIIYKIFHKSNPSLDLKVYDITHDLAKLKEKEALSLGIAKGRYQSVVEEVNAINYLPDPQHRLEALAFLINRTRRIKKS